MCICKTHTLTHLSACTHTPKPYILSFTHSLNQHNVHIIGVKHFFLIYHSEDGLLKKKNLNTNKEG